MRAVLRHIAAGDGLVSIFEATENDIIAGTLDRLGALGFIDVEILGYPWQRISLTEAGSVHLRK